MSHSHSGPRGDSVVPRFARVAREAGQQSALDTLRSGRRIDTRLIAEQLADRRLSYGPHHEHFWYLWGRLGVALGGTVAS